MKYLKDIVAQIEDLTGIREIVGASEEIASMKMRGIRNKVLLSRDLNDELTEIYREVTVSYKNQILTMLEQKKGKHAFNDNDKDNISLKRGNGKVACVYLSANSGFFSKILEKTYHEFKIYLEGHENSIPVIIGEFGKKLYLNDFPNKEYKFYAFSEEKTTEASLKQITQDLVGYENVIIFYARFESIASQTITTLDVSGAGKSANDETLTATHYLFEPSLEKILSFFETEIFAGIIAQTVTESELARYASRITTLDIARENISVKLKAINLEKRFASHRMMNKKQTEALSGISLWKLA
jgi:F0F1-type ATP synthase gamma subunit